MKKSIKDLLSIVIAMLVLCFFSCDNKEATSLKESDSYESFSSTETELDSQTELFSVTDTDQGVLDDFLNDAGAGKDQIKNTSVVNSELKTTSIRNDYYPSVEAGNYIGTDLPSEEGCYYREITAYEDFSSLVEFPNVLGEDDFMENFVLVIKRVSGGYFANIGFRDYNRYAGEIALDVYPISQGNDGVKTVIDYLLIPNRDKKNDVELGEEEHFSVGELSVFENSTSYYYCEPKKADSENALGETALYFENADLANEYLTSKGYGKIYKEYFKNRGVLLIALDMNLGRYEISDRSCYLGFENFNTNGTDIYITLRRNIVNGDYGDSTGVCIYCISVPKGTICADVIEKPSIHILVCDNLQMVFTVKE